MQRYAKDFASLTLADGHTASNAPHLFRPPKLSDAGSARRRAGSIATTMITKTITITITIEQSTHIISSVVTVSITWRR